MPTYVTAQPPSIAEIAERERLTQQACWDAIATAKASGRSVTPEAVTARQRNRDYMRRYRAKPKCLRSRVESAA